MKNIIIGVVVILICLLSIPNISISECFESETSELKCSETKRTNFPHPIYYLIINSGADLVNAPLGIVHQRKQLVDYMRRDLGGRFKGRHSAIIDISSPSEYFSQEPDDHEYLLFLEVASYYRGGPWRHLIMQYEVINRHKETIVKNQHKSETVKSHKKLSKFLNRAMARDIVNHLPGGKQYSPDMHLISERLIKSNKEQSVGPRGSNSIEDRILKLNELKAKGLISDKEYKEKKTEILEDL